MMFPFDPSPSPSVSYLDPFGPLPVDELPAPPGWLFPAVLAIFFTATAAVAVLLVMWGIAQRKAAAALAAGRGMTADWVNLKDFNPKADPRRPKSPKVVREDDVNRRETPEYKDGEGED